MAEDNEYRVAQLQQACPGATVACIPTSPVEFGALCDGCDENGKLLPSKGDVNSNYTSARMAELQFTGKVV